MTYKEACKQLHQAHNPRIVLLNPGTRGSRNYDAFPYGHPIPAGSCIVAFWYPDNSPGGGYYKQIPDAEEMELGISCE